MYWDQNDLKYSYFPYAHTKRLGHKKSGSNSTGNIYFFHFSSLNLSVFVHKLTNKWCKFNWSILGTCANNEKLIRTWLYMKNGNVTVVKRMVIFYVMGFLVILWCQYFFYWMTELKSYYAGEK